VFCWDKILDMDNGRLKKFLTQKFGIDWVKNAEIKKIDNGKIIKIYTETNSLSLKINDERTEVSLEMKISDLTNLSQ